MIVSAFEGCGWIVGGEFIVASGHFVGIVATLILLVMAVAQLGFVKVCACYSVFLGTLVLGLVDVGFELIEVEAFGEESIDLRVGVVSGSVDLGYVSLRSAQIVVFRDVVLAVIVLEVGCCPLIISDFSVVMVLFLQFFPLRIVLSPYFIDLLFQFGVEGLKIRSGKARLLTLEASLSLYLLL
jgi:hypothetical protein